MVEAGDGRRVAGRVRAVVVVGRARRGRIRAADGHGHGVAAHDALVAEGVAGLDGDRGDHAHRAVGHVRRAVRGVAGAGHDETCVDVAEDTVAGEADVHEVLAGHRRTVHGRVRAVV